jgi:hypothetical protein
MFYWLDSFVQCLLPFVKRWRRTIVETYVLSIVEKSVYKIERVMAYFAPCRSAPEFNLWFVNAMYSFI